MKIQTKICGLTRQQDIQTAVQAGTDAIGFVFYPPSPRYITIEQASELAKNIPAFTTVVALVVNMLEQDLVTLSHYVPFDIIQFHGDESAHVCHLMAQRVCKRWIKAIRVKPDDTSEIILDKINELSKFGASGVILDTFNEQVFGGTGQAFDWTKIPHNSPIPIYLAGGLTPENIGDITANKALVTKITGVDVSGGVELSKGVKDAEKMQKFIENVRKIGD